MSVIKKQSILIRKIALFIFFSAITFATTSLTLKLSVLTGITTTAFCFLIIVLLAAFFGDVFIAIGISIIATICFDYFYLPPVGKFTIQAIPDSVALITFLLTSVMISKLTSAAADKATRLKILEQSSARLREFGTWLIETPNENVTLSLIAQKALDFFKLDYCAVHVYGEGKWYHYTGSAKSDISQEIERSAAKKLQDHPTEIMDLADEDLLDVQYAKIDIGLKPYALIVAKGDTLPSAILPVVANTIGLRLVNIT